MTFASFLHIAFVVFVPVNGKVKTVQAVEMQALTLSLVLNDK